MQQRLLQLEVTMTNRTPPAVLPASPASNGDSESTASGTGDGGGAVKVVRVAAAGGPGLARGLRA